MDIKKKLFSIALFLSLAFGGTVYAATYSYGDWYNGVRSTERWHDLNYLAEAWTTRPGHKTGIYYYRSGKYVGGVEAYKDSWRRDGSRVHNSTVIWDSFSLYAPKTSFTYKL
ncbi:hypothetical protein ACVRYP_07840 [Streptococcus rifensis]